MNTPFVFKRCAKCGEYKVASTVYFYKDKAGNEYKVYSQYPNDSISVYKLLGNNVDWDNEW